MRQCPYSGIVNKEIPKLLNADSEGGIMNPIDQLRDKYPRAMKLMERGDEFLVVKCSEPYAKRVAQEIRLHEGEKETWTDDCEAWMKEHIPSWSEKAITDESLIAFGMEKRHRPHPYLYVKQLTEPIPEEGLAAMRLVVTIERNSPELALKLPDGGTIFLKPLNMLELTNFVNAIMSWTPSW